MPPPSWVSPRSAMDTADDSRELTDGRRTNCGPAERDEDRDWKFMAPRASRLGIVYRRGIWWSKIGVGSRMVDLCSTCRVESLSVTSTEYRSRWCRSKADVPSGQAEEGAGSAAVLAGLGLLRQAMGRPQQGVLGACGPLEAPVPSLWCRVPLSASTRRGLNGTSKRITSSGYALLIAT